MRYRCLLPLLMILPLGAQVVRDNGFVYGADFGQWSITGQGQTQGILNIQPASLCNTSSGGYSFPAFAINRPITITDAVPGQNETVTVTSVETNASGCIVTTQPMQHLHQTYSISSGTAGLQEAIDFSGSAQPALVILTPQWLHEHGNVGMITAAHGTVGISILDQTTAVPGAYLWDGTQYVLQDASSDFTARALAQAAQTTANTALANAAAAQAAANLAQTTANAAQASANLALAELAAQNVIIISGTDLGAEDCTVDAQYAGTPAIFQVTAPGTFLSAPCTSAGHTLQIKAPVTMTSTGTLGSDASVQCIGSGSIMTSTIAPGAALFDVTGSLRATIDGCHVEANYNPLAYSSTQTADLTITRNLVHNGGLYQQQGASASNPTVRPHIVDNRAYCDGYCGIVGILAYGATQGGLFSLNHFAYLYHGIELYADTSAGQGASSYPLRAQIATSGLQDDIISINTFDHIGASFAWTSVASRITMVGNIGNTCGDVGYDLEASVDSHITSNTATGCTNGDIAEFYGGDHNVADGNLVTSAGEVGFTIRNASGTPTNSIALTMQSNTFIYPNGVGVWLYNDPNTSISAQGNTVTNGLLAYSQGTYVSSQDFKGNQITYTAVIPSSNVGSPSGSGSGLALGNFQDGTFGIAEGNTIITTVPQTQPCLSGGTSQPNIVETTTFDGNKCIGPWGTDVSFTNSGGNASTAAYLILRNNGFATNTVNAVATKGSLAPIVQKFGNYIMSTGAAAN